MRPLLSESASERLIQFSEDYFGILFSLFRLKHLQDIYSVPQLKSDILREEIYGSYSATLIGRIAHISKVFSIRGYGHQRRKMDKVIDEDSERIFIDDLSSKLSLIDNISLKQSQNILEKAIRNYCTKRVKNPDQNLPRLLRIILRILRRLFSKPKLQYRDIISLSKTNNEIRLACIFLDMENEANS